MIENYFNTLYSRAMHIIDNLPVSSGKAYLVGKSKRLNSSYGYRKESKYLFDSLVEVVENMEDLVVKEEYLREAIISASTVKEFTIVSRLVNNHKNTYSRVFMLVDIGILQAEMGHTEKADKTADKIYKLMSKINSSNAAGMVISVLAKSNPVRAVQYCSMIEDGYIRARKYIDIMKELSNEERYYMLVKEIVTKICEYQTDNEHLMSALYSRLSYALSSLGYFEDAFDVIEDQIPYVEDSLEAVLMLLDFYTTEDDFFEGLLEYSFDIMEDLPYEETAMSYSLSFALKIVDVSPERSVEIVDGYLNFIKDIEEHSKYIRAVEKAAIVLLKSGAVIKGFHLLDSALQRVDKEEKFHKNDIAKKYLPIAKIYGSLGYVDRALEIFEEFQDTESFQRLIVNVSLGLSRNGDFQKAVELIDMLKDENTKAESLLDCAFKYLENKDDLKKQKKKPEKDNILYIFNK